MAENTGEMELGDLVQESFDFKQMIWKVPNVLSLPKLVDYKVCSSPFPFAGATWRLEMYPYGESIEETEGTIDLMIVRLDSQIPEHHVFYKFCFKTRHGKDFEGYCSSHCFNSKSSEGGVIRYLENSIFLKKKHIIASNGVLTVLCQLRTKKAVVTDRDSQIESCTTLSDSDCSSKPKLPISLHDNKACCDFKEFFLKQEGCDVLLKVKGVEFSAHRAILSARSSIFASTFLNDMKEKETAIINIEDCDSSSFSDFLCFIYCGDIQNLSSENVLSLFTAADKYDVADLRTKCIEFMKDNLSVDTFCDTVTLALQHQEKELIKATTDFFIENLKKIIVTGKWESFVLENPKQSNELMVKALVPDFNKGF